MILMDAECFRSPNKMNFIKNPREPTDFVLTNEITTVITLLMIPILMQHDAIAHHCGCEPVAMAKFLPYPVFWPFVEPVLFWKGETDSGEKVSKQT